MGEGFTTPVPEAKAESTLPFLQLWDEEEEKDDITNLPMTGPTRPIVAEDSVVIVKYIFGDLHPKG